MNSVSFKKYNVLINVDSIILPDDRIKNSLSLRDGLDAVSEVDLRILGCQLIQTSGILLKLPQIAMATGQILFQRYYYAKSFVKYPMEITAMACIVLASKIEGAQRKIRDVINVFNHMKQVRNGKIFQPVIRDCHYITLKKQVVMAEGRVLKELGFCFHIKHAHKIMIMYLRFLEAEKKLSQCAWNYINDALRTDVFVRYTPETIACSCIWLAGRHLKVPLPENPPWYHAFQVTKTDIEDIAASILKLYTRRKVKLEELTNKTEQLHRKLLEERLRRRSESGASSSTTSSSSTSGGGKRSEGETSSSITSSRIALKREHSFRKGPESDLTSSEGASITSGERAPRLQKRSCERRRSRSRADSSRSRTSGSSTDQHRKKAKRSHSPRSASRDRSRKRAKRSPSRGHSQKMAKRSHSRRSSSRDHYQSRRRNHSRVPSPHRHCFVRDSDRRHPSWVRSRSPLRSYDRYAWPGSSRIYDRH